MATAQALLQKDNEAPELYFIGAAGGMERKLVAASGVDFNAYHEVLAGPVHGVNPIRILFSLTKLKLGIFQSFVHLMRIRPKVILLTGGWANLPLALSARLLRIPTVIYLPDIEPGLTIKALQPFAHKVAITVARSARFFPREKNSRHRLPRFGNSNQRQQSAGLAAFWLGSRAQDFAGLRRQPGRRAASISLSRNICGACWIAGFR